MSIEWNEGPHESLETFIATAPLNLQREGFPTALTADKFESAYGLIAGQAPTPDALTVLQKAREQGWQHTPTAMITAREMLLTGLEVPKHYSDKEGLWFLDLNSFELIPYIASLHGEIDEYRANKWATKPYEWRDNGNGDLWEQGILVSTSEQVGTIVLSMPWDGSNKGWYKRLSSVIPFNVYKDLQNDFAQDLSGMSADELHRLQIVKGTDTDRWWNAAKQRNRILRYPDDEAKAEIGASFGKRILSKLAPKVEEQKLDQILKNATGIYGYYVQCADRQQSGNMYRTLHLSDNLALSK